MLGLATSETATGVAEAARRRLVELSVSGVVHVLEADVQGLVRS